jgi:RNA polymerase sigma-70 factor (ECF subfamily)
VRQQLEGKDLDAALETTLRCYGPEIYGFLVGLHRDETVAADVFSRFSEYLWRGLPDFDWGCTLRTWAYVLARNASHRHRSRDKHAGREVALDSHSPALGVEAALRTATDAWRRTDTKQRFAELRASLSPEDQELLVLRIDRGLEWNDVARVILGDEHACDDELKRKAALLRKRFQLLREELHDLARRAGLVPGDEGQ